MSSNWAALQAKLGGGGGGRGGGSRGAGGGRGGGRAGGNGKSSKSSNSSFKTSFAKPAPPPQPAAPPPFAAPDAPPLLEPGDRLFDEVAAQCYRGFVCQRATSSNALPSSLTARVAASLERLRAQRLFRHDIVLAPQRGVSVPTPTVVSRILVGEPGVTYKYLGLRTFAYPWVEEAGGPPGAGALRALNDALVAHTERLNGASKAPVAGSCRYNLSLVNLLLPDDARGGALRNRAGARLGGAAAEQAVSWHADSGVEPNSAIAVLNLEPAACQRGRKGSKPWRIAMKCVGGGHEPTPGVQGQVGGNSGTPAIAVPLRDGDAYYMLCGFNEAHHHAVLAGSSGRYSSTHRVGLSATDTWSYIEARAAAARGAPPLGDAAAGWRPLTLAAVRLAEEAHTEIELEWLRPWAAQGLAHAESHGGYWRPRIEKLVAAWGALEARTAATVALLEAAAGMEAAAAAALLPEGVRCFDVLLQLLERRESQRDGWRARLASRSYREAPPHRQPFELLPPDASHAAAIAAVRAARGKFAQRAAKRDAPSEAAAGGGGGGGGGGKKRKKLGGAPGAAAPRGLAPPGEVLAPTLAPPSKKSKKKKKRRLLTPE